MGAKHPDFPKVYEAADLWVERALRSDDSLFEPRAPIWSRDLLQEARERFVFRPDRWKGKDFFGKGKLEAVLAGSPPEVYQLVGEAVYVTYLIVHRNANLYPNPKMENINRVLRWSGKRAVVPNILRDAQKCGIMDPGTFFDSQVGVHPAFVIEFAYQWKLKGWGDELLNRNDPKAPWAFKKTVMEMNLPVLTKGIREGAPNAQRVALLHLVHPCVFEAMSVPYKERRLATAPKFQRFITEPTNDADCKIRQIRVGLEEEIGEFATFFDPHIVHLWQ